jgi:type IV pilus assembly protein PilX
MSRPAPTTTTRPRARQSGVTLIVSMILLLVMSLLAITSLRGTVMQERMSANTYDRDLAFQTAEAGLRMGEYQAENWSTKNIPPPVGCPASNPPTGLYINTSPMMACAPLWEEAAPGKSGSYWHDASLDSGDITMTKKGLSLTPYYIVELISSTAPCNPSTPAADQNCRRFRVTATSDADGRAKVVLQSIYATANN